MKVAFEFPNASQTKVQHLIVKGKIGKGKFGVYYSVIEDTEQEFALKVFPKDDFSTKQYQKELALAQLNHKNIIRYNHIISHKPGYNFILTEYAPYGDFFDLVQNEEFDDELIIRTYFHQLIDGLEHIHSQGLSHLDLKLENLMLGKDMTLRIIDFDQAQRITEKEITSGGTIGYRAPEVKNGRCKDFRAADIYSAGIILFALKAKEYPFVETKEKVIFYDTFINDNKAFWKEKADRKGDKYFFIDSLKALLNGMLVRDPRTRLTIDQIKASKWYNGSILGKLALQEKMKNIRKSKESKQN